MTRLIATNDTLVRKQQEMAEKIEKTSDQKKCAENHIGTLERNINALKEDSIKLRSALELSEREKKLLEKNIAKLDGK